MEGETLPRFDSKSRMFGNVKYPRKHRMPGYTQKAAFFHLEIITRCASLQYYTVLVYASVLVGAVHFRLFPIFKAHFRCQAYLLDTIYCICAPRIAYIQCASCACCPCGHAATWPCARARVRVRPRVCVGVRVCSRAARRPCNRAQPCVCVGVRVCRACFRCSRHFIRLYGRFSRRASARWACRKLF